MKDDWPGLLFAGLLIGAMLAGVGSATETRWLVGLGVLLMIPILLAIVFALAALGAEKAQEGAELLFGKGLLSKAIFWIVFLLIACLFLFAGAPDLRGPSFWGSID